MQPTHSNLAWGRYSLAVVLIGMGVCAGMLTFAFAFDHGDGQRTGSPTEANWAIAGLGAAVLAACVSLSLAMVQLWKGPPRRAALIAIVLSLILLLPPGAILWTLLSSM
jgi:hypothetical protein